MTASAAVARPVIVGANHRSSSLALRDQLFVEDAAAPAFLEGLRGAGLSQAVVLSTCDRVEVLTFDADPLRAARVASEALAARASLPVDDLSSQLYTLVGKDAVRHFFAVTSSLDSLVIGEPHVLGQVKAVHRISREAGMAGPEVEALLQAAYTAAKRVRTETRVAERPVSIASAAVQFARDLHGDLSECSALLVGAGDMGELIAEQLLAYGLQRLVVTAPRQGRAEAVANGLGCHWVAFDELQSAIPQADIVLTAVSGRHTLIGPEHVQQALKKRRRKPIFMVDAGIPGDVDPAVNRVEGVFLYDLTDLERVAMEGRATREAAAREAWGIVDSEVLEYTRGRAERAAVPAIVALRAYFEAVREQVLAEASGDADKATRLLIHRLLHGPSETMKEIAGVGDGNRAEWERTEQLLRRLFRLE